MEDRLEQLWNEEVGLYLNRREDTGEFTYRLSPFHFHALFSKKVGTERVNRILKEHFYNDQEFYGTYILPSIARNDPSYIKQTYWQGRIWAPMNYLVYLALGEYKLEQERKDLAVKSEQLILKEWLEHGHVHENYDPENGEGCNNPRSDKFYHWGGLLAYIAIDFSMKERSKDRS
jgi:glycogen debranching enzyme